MKSQEKVLCVDLDGTILATDLLWESLLIFLKTRIWAFPQLLMWLLKGKAYFKHKISQHVVIDPTTLPYRQEVIKFLKEELLSGREIILATASNEVVANKIANHLGLFSKVLSSDEKINLRGQGKLKAIQKEIGERSFDYLGDEKADIPLWQASLEVLVVNPSSHVIRAVQKMGKPVRILSQKKSLLPNIWKAIRSYQWVKNILVFIPLLGAHQFNDKEALLLAIFAFCSLSLCASSGYILNDLLDLEADREHLKKQFRPFAAGMIPIPVGLVLFVVLLSLGGLVAGLFLPLSFGLGLGFYFLGTVIYSLSLKSIVLVDILALASMYTLRVILGGWAVNVPISHWLLVFALFFFLSLALIKRYTELQLKAKDDQGVIKGRGYSHKDKEFLGSMGLTTGFISILVLALYLNSKEVTLLYEHPDVLWLVLLLLLYWMTRIWFLTYRGTMNDDPILFTFKDWVSYSIGLGIFLIIILAI